MAELSPPAFGSETRGSPALKDVARLRRASWAFTTRRVAREAVTRVLVDESTPEAGDLVLARVDSIGHHRQLQLSTGRRKHLFVGDEIVVTYGNRYAPSQFEAVVPKSLVPCHLVAGGGVAAKARSWHTRIARGPTQLTPLGLLANAEGKRTNLRDHALPAMDHLVGPWPTTVAVVGTAMDSGKTNTAAFLVHGLTLSGMRVGYAKVTGTGAGGDTWLVADAGADPVLDFTDTGLASTYLVSQPELEGTLVTLVAHLVKAGVDAIVLELADGVLQAETAALLGSKLFRDIVGGILFASRDGVGAVAGVDVLRRHGLPALGLSGVLTSSPLQCQEASIATGLPIFRRSTLAQVKTAVQILARAEELKAIRGGADAGRMDPAVEHERVSTEEADTTSLSAGRPGSRVSSLRSEHKGS